MPNTILAPSLMCMDLSEIKEQLNTMNKYASLYHVDIMDGHFCKNITLSPALLQVFRKYSNLEIDVHLMTTNPCDWIETVAKAGATYISPHAETINTEAFRVMNLIKSLGCKTGVVVNPATSISSITPYLGRVDLLTIMTVDVGFAGQPFIEEMFDKVREAKQIREMYGFHYKIQIDGGCSKATYRSLVDAGADILIVGNTGLFSKDPNLDKAYQKLNDEFRKCME